MKTHRGKLAAATIALAALAGCADRGDSDADTGLGGTSAQFDAMTNPCIEQAATVSGLAPGNILVTDKTQTGGGPLLTLSAAGADYGCRMEADGSVTVFSEFAN
jgi:hypothetical protein